MQKPSSTKLALLIGINDYPNLLPENQLSGCINDVDLMHGLLSRRFGFPEDGIKCLRNEQASRDGILEACKDLVTKVTNNDIVVFYFAGHGSHVEALTKESGWMETIVPYDSGRQSTGHPSTDITDVEIKDHLLNPLVHKTSFVTLIFDSCHSGSVLRSGFGPLVRGIDPDGATRKYHTIDQARASGWLPAPTYRSGDPLAGYVLIASCRADEFAGEMSVEEKCYGAFTYLLCKLINESQDEKLRTLIRLASVDVTAHYPRQHPILEGAHDALIFGTDHLETPRHLPVKKVIKDGKNKWIEIGGGLATGITRDSIFAVRPVGQSPQNSDARIKIKEVTAFAAIAKVIQEGPIEPTFGCFEVSHSHGGAALNILVDSNKNPDLKELLLQIGNPEVSGVLNLVKSAKEADVRVLLQPSPREAVIHDDQLVPLNRSMWVALSRDGRNILPPTPHVSNLCENLRKLARYQFGLRLRNIEERNELRGKLSLRLRRRPKGSRLVDQWRDPPMANDGFPRFQNGDHIACVIKNTSEIAVWPYVVEFAEDGSVHQRYPAPGGEELLASNRSTKEVAPMSLTISSENSFQIAAVKSLDALDSDGRSRKKVTEVMKLFVATERLDLSLLLQTSLTPATRGVRGLPSLLGSTEFVSRGPGPSSCSWWTVEVPFVLESDLIDEE